MKRMIKWMVPGLMIAAASCAGMETDVESVQSGLEGTWVDGNPTCADLGLGEFEFKIESEDESGVLFDGYNTIEFTYLTESTFEFTSTLGIDAVIMKGGPNALVYEFDPETYGESGLATPVNTTNGGRYGISHVSFCYDYEVSVSKTASTSYTRTWDWSIDKSVDVALHQLTNSEVGTSTYSVDVTSNGYVDSDFRVAGTVTVENATPFDARLASVTDELSDGTAISLNCGVNFPVTLSPGDSLNCTYDSALADATDLVNTATATEAANSTVLGGSATADVSFGSATVTNVNETVTIEDNFEGDIVELGQTSGSTNYSYSRDFTCDDEGQNNNTASIVETGQEDSEMVRVICAETDDQGCTPGYWKNHLSAWHGYHPDDLITSVFSEAAGHVKRNDTLEDALNYKGGGKFDKAVGMLLRASVAALLDASDPDVDYPISASEVIQRTNDAIATGDRDEVLRVKDILDQYNNLGCPL